MKVGKVTKVKIEKVSLVGEGACSGAEIKLFKNKKEDDSKVEELLKSLSEEDKAKLLEELNKAKTQEEEPKKEEPKKGEEPKKEKEEDMKKAKSEVEVELEKARQQVAELEKAKEENAQMKAVLEKLKKESDERLMQSKLEKYKTSGVDEGTIRGLFEKAKGDEKFEEMLDGILGMLNKVGNDSALFKSKGVDGDAEPEKASEKLNKLAKARAAEQSCSYEIAYRDVLHDNPNLYKELLKEEF